LGFKVTVLSGAEQGRSFEFDRIEVTFGRTMENDVVLADPGISRQHLSIRNKGGAFILRDMGSSNGTMLNGKKVQEEVLKPGDVIVMGGAKVRFDGGSGGAESAPAASQKALTGDRGARGARGARGRAARSGAGRAKRSPERAAKAARARAARGERAGGGGRDARANKKAAGPLIRSKGARKREAKQKIASGDLGTNRASAGVIRRLKIWFGGLEKKKKILIVSVFGLLLLFASAGVFWGGKQVVHDMSWYDQDIFGVDEKTGKRSTIYGVGRVDTGCKFRVAFQFKYASGRATLSYRVGNVSQKGEVQILLNGEHVQFAPLTLEGLSPPMTIDLPRKHLIENEINKIEFMNALNRENPPVLETWSVVIDQIKEVPIPAPDKEKAEASYVKAKRAYKERTVEPGNAYRAMEHYQKVRDYLELLPEDARPTMYNESTEKVREIDKELNKRFVNMKFQAAQKVQFKRYKEAKDIFRLILLTFPNQEDSRYQMAEREYDKFQ